jgi:hypothetical protein
MSGNPRSTSFQAACCRHAAASETDDSRREALEIAAENLEKMSTAIPAIKAVLAIYGAFPDAKLGEVREIS